MIHKYKTKERHVEAIEFKGAENAHEIIDWLKANGQHAMWSPAAPSGLSDDIKEILDGFPERLYIDPLGKAIYAHVGDFIIKDQDNHFFIKQKYAFAAQYEVEKD